MKRLELVLVLLAFVALAGQAAPVHAAGVVTNCTNDTDFASALVGGGSITFQCGKAKIILTATETISADTVIDGGNKITLSGDDARQLFQVSGGFSLQLKNIVLMQGFGSQGGAIENHGNLLLDHVTIQDSHANSSGGAIYNDSQLQVLNSTLMHNTALVGAAIDNTTVAPRHDTPARNPQSTYYAVIQNSVLTHNSAGNSGGALHNNTNSDLLNVTLSYNTASSSGGGISNDNGGMTIDRSTFISNTSQFGGGVDNVSARIAMSSTTFSQNYATDDGGGIENLTGNASLWNVTFVGNGSVFPGGALYSNISGGGSLYARNVLLAKTIEGGNCQILPPTLTPGSNLSSDNTCNFGTGRDNVNPMLGALAYNGGTTLSYMPQTGSPAIDHGEMVDCAPNDQRGVSMPKGSACEVGSIEICTQKPFTAFLTTPGNGKKAKGPQVKLAWTAGYCATTYTVTVREDSKTGKKVLIKKNLDAMNIQTTPLIQGKTYYWMVKTCNNLGCAKSTGSTFSVK